MFDRNFEGSLGYAIINIEEIAETGVITIYGPADGSDFCYKTKSAAKSAATRKNAKLHGRFSINKTFHAYSIMMQDIVE